MSDFKMISCLKGNLGKFTASELEVLGDAYKIGDAVYSFAALGSPHSIVDYVEPIDPATLLEKKLALQRAIVDATQKRLDDFAQARGYDGILSASTYVASQIPRFAQDGRIAVQLRDLTWAKLYELMGDVESGKRSMPANYSEIEVDLPVLSWEVA